MVVSFIEKHTYSAEIDFNNLKQFIKADLVNRTINSNMITNELIYSAFRKNPEFYLTKIGYMSTSSDVADNLTTIKLITDKFFVFCMKDVKTCYYVMKGGEVLANYDDPDMAKYYAHRMDGYIIKVE